MSPAMRPPVLQKLSDAPLDELVTAIAQVVRSGCIAHVENVELDQPEALELAQRLGTVFVPVALPADKDVGEVTRVRESGTVTAATNWHYDQSFSEKPPHWSLLYCVDPGPASVPTAFCDSAALLSCLSRGLRAMLNSLEAEHLAYYPEIGQGPEQAVARATHAVVMLAEQNVEALFVAPATVSSFCGWSAFDSKPLLDFLYRMMNWPEVTAVHYWQRQDLLVWPNRRYAHRALALDSGGTRELLRIVGHWRIA